MTGEQYMPQVELLIRTLLYISRQKVRTGGRAIDRSIVTSAAASHTDAHPTFRFTRTSPHSLHEADGQLVVESPG